MVCELLSSSLQLKRLELSNCNDFENFVLTPLILRDIALHSINLVELEFTYLRWGRTPSLLNENLRHLGALRQLKFIKIDLHSAISFKILINTFSKNEVPVEKILLNFYFQTVDPCDYMLTIKTLKYLKIGGPLENINFFNKMLDENSNCTRGIHGGL